MGNWRIISLVLAISMANILHSSHAHDQPEDYVIAHSCIRKAYGLEPLCWDKKLAEVAAQWADVIQDCNLVHNYNHTYGENLGMGPRLNAAWATQMWIDEKPDYDYEKNECIDGKMCGHYTQVVWGASRRIGCARKQCTDGSADNYVVVCNYDPPGNVVGQKPY